MRKDIIVVGAMLLLILVISQVKGQDAVIKKPYFPQVRFTCSVLGCNCSTPIEMPEWVFGGDIELLPIEYGQDTIIKADVYKTDRPSLLVNETQVIISSEYLDLVLEPIPGKQTRWRITREEVISEPVITTVNDTELTYTGSWVPASGSWGSVTYSSQVGATAKYSFTGNRIEVISDLAPNHGLLGFTIDGKPEESVNLYSPARINGQVVIERTLTDGSHTITFRVGSETVLIDYLRIRR